MCMRTRAHTAHEHTHITGTPAQSASLRPLRAPLCTWRKGTTEGEAGQRIWVPGGGEGQHQSRAGASSFSASAGPGDASSPGGSASELPTALPWSLPLCRFCLRVSLYRSVMSLEVKGLCHCQSGQDPGATESHRGRHGAAAWGRALTVGRSATPST